MLKLSQTVKHSQKLSQTQEIKISLSQKLAMRQNMNNFFKGFYPPSFDEKTLEILFQNFLQEVSDEELSAYIKDVISPEDFKQFLNKNNRVVAMSNKTNMQSLSLQYVFSLILKNQGEQEKTLDQYDEKIFLDAFADRKKSEKEMNMLKSFLAENNNPETLKRYMKIHECLSFVHDDTHTYSQNIAQIMDFLLNTKVNGERNIKNFFREKMIVEEMHDVCSERFLKRYLERFMDRKLDQKNESLKCALINTLSEFMLLSLGILHPSLFKAQAFCLQEEKIEALQKATNSNRDELIYLFKYYGLRGVNGDPVFFCRWYMNDTTSTKNTDEAVKSFFAYMREHQKSMLKPFEYEKFLNTVIDIKKNRHLSREEKEERLIEALSDGINQEEFKKIMLKMLSVDIFGRIFSFLSQKNNG